MLARGYVSKSFSFLITAMIYSSSYVLVTVNQPMSEGAGLAALWWYFWSIDRALRKNGSLGDWLSMVLFSILLGITTFLLAIWRWTYIFILEKVERKGVYTKATEYTNTVCFDGSAYMGRRTCFF